MSAAPDGATSPISNNVSSTAPRTRVLAMLNIVGRGMGGDPIEQNLDDMDAAATAKMAMQYPETIVGVKTAHYRSTEWIPVERAVEAGTKADIPVMVDFGSFLKERPFEELVTKKLRARRHVYAYLSRPGAPAR